MFVIGKFEKAQAAKLDFQISWLAWLASGDGIDTAIWSVTSGLTIASYPAPSVASNVSTVWLEGGTPGSTYVATCTVTTTAGRIDERSIQIQVR